MSTEATAPELCVDLATAERDMARVPETSEELNLAWSLRSDDLGHSDYEVRSFLLPDGAIVAVYDKCDGQRCEAGSRG